jgi:hypothetical protein
METTDMLRARYQAAGVNPTEEELQRWAGRYAAARAAADRLFALPEAKYEDVGAIFLPTK